MDFLAALSGRLRAETVAYSGRCPTPQGYSPQNSHESGCCERKWGQALFQKAEYEPVPIFP
jgi:hypothetical protein